MDHLQKLEGWRSIEIAAALNIDERILYRWDLQETWVGRVNHHIQKASQLLEDTTVDRGSSVQAWEGEALAPMQDRRLPQGLWR